MPVTYRPAPAVERIARKLIAEHHDHLDGWRIDYVFRSTHANKGGRAVAGTARKMSGLNAYLATPEASELGGDVDPFFVIEIAEDFWAEFDANQRRALVDHELSHCQIEWDDAGEKASLVIVGHDLEEFRSIVERHGLWSPDLEAMARTMAEAPTPPSLFDVTTEGGTTVVTIDADTGEVAQIADAAERRKGRAV